MPSSSCCPICSEHASVSWISAGEFANENVAIPPPRAAEEDGEAAAVGSVRNADAT
jgi:hypothetical protein